MGTHPLNLGVRFVLELGALIAVGWWAWESGPGPWRFVLMIIVPLSLAGIWAVFNVAEDPSRSGRAPVAVPGRLRLAIEIIMFGLGFAAWNAVAGAGPARVFAGLVVLHYAASHDRIRWLLTRC